jgi:hypothetical protein
MMVAVADVDPLRNQQKEFRRMGVTLTDSCPGAFLSSRAAPSATRRRLRARLRSFTNCCAFVIDPPLSFTAIHFGRDKTPKKLFQRYISTLPGVPSPIS